MGQDPVVTGLVVALLCRGHVLLEGVPGVAKTLLVRALAASPGARDPARAVHPRPDARRHHRLAGLRRPHRRLRLPARARSSRTCCSPTRSTGRPRRPRPRCSRRWRSGRSRSTACRARCPTRSWSCATQNPVEYEGTYPLPEAQLDRFLLKLTRAAARRARTRSPCWPRTTPASTRATCRRCRRSPAADDLAAGRQRSRAASRSPPRCSATSSTCAAPPAPRRRCQLGVSPRGATALLATSKAWAWLSGRDYVTPDDVKALARPTLRHRVRCAPRPSSRARTADAVLDGVLASVPVPR